MLCDSSTSRMARYTDTDQGTIHVLVPTKHQSHRSAPSQPVAFNTTIGAARPSGTTSTNTIGASTTNGSTPILHQAAPTDQPSTKPPFDHPFISTKLIKYIQKSARPACCRRLSELLNEVTANMDKSTWTALLSFETNYLLPRKRGGKRYNMTTVIKKRLEKGAEYDDINSTSPTLMRRHKLDDDGLFAAAVTSKIEDWNIKVAVRILVSDDLPAADTLEMLASLQDKHPHHGVAYNHLPPDNVIHKALQVDKDDIL